MDCDEPEKSYCENGYFQDFSDGGKGASISQKFPFGNRGKDSLRFVSTCTAWDMHR